MSTEHDLRLQLLRNIQEQFSVYEDVLRLSEEKTQALVKNKAEDIGRLTNDIVTRLESAITIDQQRCGIIGEIAGVLGVEEGTITLNSLITKWDTDDELKKIRDDFRALVKQLQTVNERNNMLVENAQVVYAKLQELLYSALDQSTGYNSSGKSVDSRQGGYFEEKA